MRKQVRELCFFLALLTGFFLLIETSFFIQSYQNNLLDISFVSKHLILPWQMLKPIILFIGIHIALAMLYAFFIGMLSWYLGRFWSIPAPSYQAIVLWCLGLVGVLMANQYYFPNSLYADLTQTVIPSQGLAKWLFISISIFFITLISAVILATISRIYLKLKCYRRYLIAWTMFVLSVCVAGVWRASSSDADHELSQVASRTRPNIIIVGVDALRPDFLPFFGGQVSTPFFSDFLSQAFVFKNALTPLARTFPSWMGILTGLYPNQLGIRFNLAHTEGVELKHSLAFVLKEQHYRTVYATDETRFSNIDTQMGFDQIITPPMGVNDFILGHFNDFPFSNLLVNTAIGEWLFPYSAGNRAAFRTYSPNRFLEKIRPILQETSSAPLFLAVHFCLPHYPYVWGEAKAEKEVLQRYQASLMRVDAQLQDFFHMLNQYQILDHAIVILLSDHGEALALNGDRVTDPAKFIAPHQGLKLIPHFYPAHAHEEALNQSAGHGTDVLSLSQYQTLLAFRVFGLAPKQLPGHSNDPVSLLDIKPTIIDWLNLTAHSFSFSGRSLVTVISGEQQDLPKRHLFLESDYSPQALRKVFPDARQVLLESLHLYEIDPKSLRLYAKKEMGKQVIASKQYADLYGNWILALYPQNKVESIAVLVNLTTGEWSDDLDSDFALHSPAKLMLSSLEAFYGAELKKIIYHSRLIAEDR